MCFVQHIDIEPCTTDGSAGSNKVLNGFTAEDHHRRALRLREVVVADQTDVVVRVGLAAGFAFLATGLAGAFAFLATGFAATFAFGLAAAFTGLAGAFAFLATGFAATFAFGLTAAFTGLAGAFAFLAAGFTGFLVLVLGIY